MSVVIAYQSLNSNVQHEHNVAASTSQQHTRKAQRTLAGKQQDPYSLSYPTIEDPTPDIAVSGPPQLLRTAGPEAIDLKRDKTKKRKRDVVDAEDKELEKAAERMRGMFEGKARQIYQTSHREFGLPCNLLVFGELNSKNPSWANTSGATGALVHASIFPKACNCFSLHSANSTKTTKFIDEGDGWVAANCNGVRVVFVHVPNSLAADKSKAITFYQTIKNKVLNNVTGGGGVIDLIMGDTNQPHALFSPENISSGMDGQFRDAHSANAPIIPADTYAVSFKGTNSVDNKKFDVAIYNTATVKKVDVRYISQLSSMGGLAAAYTDHMGVMVKVDKK